MISAEEIGSQKLYDAILNHMKNTASFISDVSYVFLCKTLSYLDLSGNPIKSIKPISELPLLREIDLSDCNLQTLEDLSTFPALKAMTLYNNYFSEEEKERLRALYPAIYFGFEPSGVDV